jgi:hypothetical protein
MHLFGAKLCAERSTLPGADSQLRKVGQKAIIILSDLIGIDTNDGQRGKVANILFISHEMKSLR